MSHVLTDVEVHWRGEPDPSSSHALEAWSVKDLELTRFRAGPAREGLPAVSVDGKAKPESGH